MHPKDSSTQKQDHGWPQMRVVETAPSCPICGEQDIATTWTRHAFDYGSGETAVTLQVCLPVHRCSTCGFEYLDEEAERLKHSAVCDHLGVLPPDNIRRIRENHRMTRAAFAQMTGLGEASLNRWENGLSVQNHANDRYLRLLARPQTMRILREIAEDRISKTRMTGMDTGRFRVVQVTEIIRKEQKAFRLNPAA